MTCRTRPVPSPPETEDTTYGNYGTRSLDIGTWFGIRCALSPGVFRSTRTNLSPYHLGRAARIHSRPRTLSEVLPLCNVCPRMGRGAYRSICYLSLVSRDATAWDDRPFNFPSRLADLESRNCRLALPWHGMEGACRLVCSHLNHDGHVRLDPVWPRP